jgi:ubiquinone/menaquinone biosynthesis C-methylase UbiE
MQRPAFIARQSARPNGVLGRLLLRLMARETARLNAEVLDAVAPRAGEHILEIGYGHGRTIASAASRAPEARFAGLDASPDAAHSATRRCRRLLAGGRLDLRIGDSASLPWDRGTFDAVLSVHTLYFWPEPQHHLREMGRILRVGGRLVLGFRERSDAAIASFPPPTYRFASVDEVMALVDAAGFRSVTVQRDRSGPGLCVLTALAIP